MSDKGILTGKIKGIVSKNARELSFLQANLAEVGGAKKIGSILVTSCSSGEGKTVSAVSMAIELASRGGVKVALLDADPQKPTLHKVFGLDANPGLIDTIISNVSLEETICSTEYEHLSVIPFGKESPDKKSGLFEADKFKNKIRDLKERFDYLLVDGPSVFDSPANALIAKHFDGVLFVIECEKTRWVMLQEAVEKVKSAKGNVIGVVMNKRKYYVPRWLYAG